LELAAEHEADATADECARHLELLGEELAGARMDRAWTRHISPVA
jgi:hypothetical protein